MDKPGFGRGYETTSFIEEATNGTQRIAAFVFWRGGGMGPDDGSRVMTAMAVSAPSAGGGSSIGRRLTLPFRLLLLGIFLPVAKIADMISARRRRKQRKPFKFVPMTAAVSEARRQTGYEAGKLKIGSASIDVPKHATLVAFVEDDPMQADGIAITTHRVATDSYRPEPPLGAAVRARLLESKDLTLKHEVLRELSRHLMQGPGQVFFAIHSDPVCLQFMRRAAGEE
jgi:hypothetical protein